MLSREVIPDDDDNNNYYYYNATLLISKMTRASCGEPGSEELLHWSKPAAASVCGRQEVDGTAAVEVRYDCAALVH